MHSKSINMARELAGGLKRVIPGSITYRNPDIKGANFSLLRVFIFGLVSSSLLSSCSEKSDGTAQIRQDNTGASKSFRGLRPVSSAAPSFGSSAGDYSPFSEVSNLVDAWNDLQAQGLVGLELGAAQEKLIRKITEEVGVAKACDVLMLVKGPGSDRSKLMEIAFAYSDEDGETLLSEASALASPDDRKAAANALNHNKSLSHLDFKGAITDFPAEIQDLFINRLSLFVSGSSSKTYDSESCLRTLLNSMPQDGVKTGLLTKFLSRVAIDSPSEAWALAESSKGMISDAEHSEVVRTIAKWMVVHDPSHAAKTMMESGNRDAFKTAVSAWLEKDFSAVQIWQNELNHSLSAENKDLVSSLIAEKYARSGDLLAARSQLNNIEDPAARGRVEGRIWSRERDILRAEVEQNPVETVNTILAGKGSFGDYWLEEAISTWVAKDFDQAVEWNEKNWASMPPAKAQYVAAAFAKHSLNQNDVDNARQWSALIQDRKTKERIEAAITNAAEGK